MSLLEDVFLQDEANEAEQLERVIEGDEFEERRRSDSDDNSEKEDEAEEDKRRVDPTKPKSTRVIKNPRFLLNPARLTGPRGIKVIPDHFKDFKFKGKGHEREDLDLVLKKLEHWAYRLYPKFQFEDCLKKIEVLGKKRPVAVHLHKIRSDQFLSEDTVVQKDSSDEDTPMPVQEEDEFDKLLQQQIELARSTPGPNSAKKPGYVETSPLKDIRTTSIIMPKATSSPSINDEQRERMLRSRKLAEERRLARLKNATSANNIVNNTSSQSVTTEIEATVHSLQNKEPNVENIGVVGKDAEEIEIIRKTNRSNVIDSSDEETAVETNVSITVDVHPANINNIEDSNSLKVSENDAQVDINKDMLNDIGDKLDDCENVICNSKSVIDTNIEPIHSNNIDTDNVVLGEKNSQENIENESHINANVSNSEVLDKTERNSADNSGDIGTLRYDDSDTNINMDEPNTHNNDENITGDASNFKETVDIRHENETEKSSEASNVESNKDNENVEDIMDVDFTEDF